jgi:hypothetical protein
MDRQTIGTILFCAFAVVWAYVAHRMFQYPHLVKKNESRDSN